jgi:hypothetical protein
LKNWDEDLDDNGTSVNDDTDGDGIPNFKDIDDNGDGIPSTEQGTKDPELDENGKPIYPDLDGDGIPDYLDMDIDDDEKPNTAENPNRLDDLRAVDTDGDGIPDFMDPLVDAPALAIEFLCDPIAKVGATLNCTIVYTNTGAITTTALWVGITQPTGTELIASQSDLRWRTSTGEVTSTDVLSNVLSYDYAAFIEGNLAPGVGGTIQAVFKVQDTIALGVPITLQGVVQNRVDNVIQADAQGESSVMIARAAIYMPLVAKASTK